VTSTVLVVEDEKDLASTLAYNFEREKLSVRVAHDGETALAELKREPRPDLVVLDLMLPDISGVEVCRRLRADPRTAKIPVMMLTARGEEIDRVIGFEVGADDYVVKPFSVREVLLRARALLRRASPDAPSSSEAAAAFGVLEIDPAGHRAIVEGSAVALTALEFRLLQTFFERRGRVQSRDTLLNDVWGLDKDVGERTVDTHVKRLREKLGNAGAYIETLRGVGYRFKLRPDEKAA
jgi:two-component system, OmpR family, phosphate regulon response regulator PhoB